MTTNGIHWKSLYGVRSNLLTGIYLTTQETVQNCIGLAKIHRNLC